MKKPTIDEATARKLAVKADCDPRTLKKVLGGGPVKSLSAKRAYATLVFEGLITACFALAISGGCSSVVPWGDGQEASRLVWSVGLGRGSSTAPMVHWITDCEDAHVQGATISAPGACAAGVLEYGADLTILWTGSYSSSWYVVGMWAEAIFEITGTPPGNKDFAHEPDSVTALRHILVSNGL